MTKILNHLKKIQYNSPVVLTYTFISLLALIAGLITKSASTRLLFSVYRSSATDVLLYFRLVGHVLGHVNWNHYFNNFLLVLLLGPMLEEKYGSKNLIIMMGFTALLSGIINIAFFNTGLLGASGIVFMMILLSSYANFQDGRIPLTLILVVITFIGKEVYAGMFTIDNISHITHIIGGACGGVFGYYLNKKASSKKTEPITYSSI